MADTEDQIEDLTDEAQDDAEGADEAQEPKAPAKKTSPKRATPRKPKDRIEVYETVNSKGETVRVEHNIDAGTTKVL